MQDILPFLIQHWALSLAFVVVFGLVIYEERKSSGAGGGFAITPVSAVNLINREKAVVIDLRSAEHFANGHVVDAINIPAADLENQLNKLQKYQSRPLILICPPNKSASLMLGKLRKGGFAKTQLLAGGIDAWQRADLPLVRS